MKNQADYSMYLCPFHFVPKDGGHNLHGPEGYESSYEVWCDCGFRGPIYVLNPQALRLKMKPEFMMLVG